VAQVGHRVFQRFSLGVEFLAGAGALFGAGGVGLCDFVQLRHGTVDLTDPLRLLPFEVRYLGRRTPPDRWVIDLSKNDSVLLKPLSYPRPEDLVALRQIAPGATGSASASDGLNLSPSMYLTYAENNRVFESLGVWVSTNGTATGVAEPEQIRTALCRDSQGRASGPLGRALDILIGGTR